MGISLRKAEMCDCGKIHKMQIELFSALLGKYKDYNTSPAAEPIEKTERRMADEFTAYYFICLDDTVIGAVRTVRLNGCTLKISPIFILPLYQGAGYAGQALTLIESLYPDVNRWELSTIKEEPKLRRFYEKMGYSLTGKEEIIQDNMTLVYYAK